MYISDVSKKLNRNKPKDKADKTSLPLITKFVPVSAARNEKIYMAANFLMCVKG